MDDTERLIKRKRELKNFIIGGNNEIIDFFCKIYEITPDCKSNILKQYTKTPIIKINDLNFFEIEVVENIVKSMASEEFHYYGDLDKYFVTSYMPDFSQNGKSHYHNDNLESAKLMINYSEFEEDDKISLLELINDFCYEIDIISFLHTEFEYNPKYKAQSFIYEIQNQDIDLQQRLQELSEIIKQLNISILKNNEVISTRSYYHKKECAELINNSLIQIKDELYKSLEFYIKTIETGDFQNLLEDVEPKEFLLGKLIENKTKLDKYLKLEKMLVKSNLLSPSFDKWLGSPLQLIEFNQFCELNKLFRNGYEKNSKGLKILRKLYRFNEGTSIDKPSKRKKANANAKINFHSYYALI